MKVTVLGLRGIPEIMGGVETHCQELLPRIKNNPEVEVTLITRKGYADTSQSSYKGIKLIHLFNPKSSALEALVHSFWALLYIRFKVPTDVLHVHAIGPSLVLPLARLLGFKVVVTHHGADYNREKWGVIASAMLKLGEYFALRFSNALICVGKSLTEELKLQKPQYSSKLRHVPNGAPVFDSPKNGENNLAAQVTDKPYLLFVGRLVPEKGIKELIAAFAELNSEHQLLVVGSADHKSPYSKAVVDTKVKNVIVAGRKSRQELAVLYANCDLFVLPSTHEGLPIVALEAMSYGAPVLLSKIAPNVDIGLPSDCYYEVQNKQALTQAISEKLARKEKNDYSALLKKYDWDLIAQETFSIYRSVI